MTTTTASNATVANLYPFVTKGQLKARLAAEPEFRLQAMTILFTLQTQHEQNTESTLSKNRQGFMSSHAVHGTRIAKKIIGGDALDAEDWVKVDSIAPRYTRQLACYFRAVAIAENPALKKVASLFSAAGAAADDAEETAGE